MPPTNRRLTRWGFGLQPVPGGGVRWFVPGRRKAVAETTVATSDLVAGLVFGGCATFRQVGEAINCDTDATELVAVMARHGVLDVPLESDGHTVRFGVD